MNLKIYQQGISSVLLEGGAKAIQYFLNESHWQRIYSFVAPTILGAGLEYANSIKLNDIQDKLILEHSKSITFENDVLITGIKKYDNKSN